MDTNGSYAWRTSQRSNLGTWHHFRCSTKTEVALLQQNRLHHCNEYLIATPKMLKQINQVNSYHEWIAEASYILFSLVLATQSACAIIVTFEGSSLELRSEHTLKRTGPAIQRLGSHQPWLFFGRSSIIHQDTSGPVLTQRTISKIDMETTPEFSANQGLRITNLWVRMCHKGVIWMPTSSRSEKLVNAETPTES